MKFGKHFASQTVPEWHEAYLDYSTLKTNLKQIRRFKNNLKKTTTPPNPLQATRRRQALYRAFSGLTALKRFHEPAINPITDIENPVILVDKVNLVYQTRFLNTNDEGGEYELVYFRRLDDEFNKVNKFYVMKVDEVVKEAQMLEKQMDALIAFRIKVDKPHGWIDSSTEVVQLASDVEASSAVVFASAPFWAKSGRSSIELIKEDEETDESSSDEKVVTQNTKLKIQEKQEEISITPNPVQKNQEEIIITPNPNQILDHVTMNVTLETPLSTIKKLLSLPNQTELKFNRENLKKAEEQLKQAFNVFYHKLRLLKSYSFMNIMAISKIMKKYDKIASRCASKSYMKMVDDSFLGSSNEVNKLIVRVEETFIEHFSNSNRRKGMKVLRPKAKREKHIITFSFGFVAGCTVALVLALVLIIRARNILHDEGGSQYMRTMFPLYSLFAFVVLHMTMYATNIYFWRKYRVNYSFILGFKQGTELGYRDVMYLSFSIAVLALASILSNLDMEMDPKTHDYKAYTELLPLILVMGLFATWLCPFNILYRSSRFFLLKCVFRCLCAPLYMVTLADCMLADQLTSQVQAFRSIEFYICYYGWGDYKHRVNTCRTNDAYSTFYFIVAAVPYGMRLLQCLRRLFEEKDALQGYNGLKYLATIVAVCTRTAYNIDGGNGWKIVAWICSAVAAIYCTYWDIVIDWGLIQRRSSNRWLRDKLLIPHQSVYFGAMVLNVVLRFAWLQTVLNFRVSSLHTEALTAIVVSLEIIRRGIWNFFRLENEHLNNVGKFRAFKSVPLPFNYEAEEQEQEKHE